jgi:AcrR family transcriptional regulator
MRSEREGRRTALGRPRNHEADEAILRATLETVAERGVHDATTDEIAARAQVGKDTIYRRWSSKVDLVRSALERFGDVRPSVTDSGNVVEDVDAYLSTLAALLMRSTEGRALSALVSESARDATLARQVDTTWRAWLNDVRVVLERAEARGELVRTESFGLLPDLLVGPVAAQWLLGRTAMAPPEISGLVHTVLDAQLDAATW